MFTRRRMMLNSGYRPSQEIKIKANVGDIIYYDGSFKAVHLDSFSQELGEPIGVCVIPSDILPDGRGRMVSLEIPSGEISWSENEIDTSLLNYNKVPITKDLVNIIHYNSSGLLPSDHFDEVQSYWDPESYYYDEDYNYYIPSPYKGDILYEYYNINPDGTYALSDFNGLSNTQTLVSLGSDYVAANLAWNHNDGVSNVQWYLPSIGELGFLMVRLYKILNSFFSLNKNLPFGNYSMYWSSTEAGTFYVWGLDSSDGEVFTRSKGSTQGMYVLPFAMI